MVIQRGVVLETVYIKKVNVPQKKLHNVRAVAAAIFAKLLNRQGSLTRWLPSYTDKLTERDKRLAHELCYGSCRWYPLLHWYLEQLLRKKLRNKDKDIFALLIIGLYQLEFTRIPPHAAINETVNAVKAFKKPWAEKFINGVLRNYLRTKEHLQCQAKQQPSLSYSHPNWLLTALQAAWPVHFDSVLKANNHHPPFTLRINRQQTTRAAYLVELTNRGIHAIIADCSPWGIVVSDALPVDQLPGFAVGAVSVQDDAAQLAAPLLQLQPNIRVLDACCAPGGKTCHIGESEPLVDLVAVDVDERRLQRVYENLARLNITAEVICADVSSPADWWDGCPFDRILLDVPCSGTGVIRRHPDIKLLREKEDIAALVERQKRLLQVTWPLLKPGGLLLYATCSVLPAENSSVIEWFIDQYKDALHDPIAASWGVDQLFGRQLLPQIDGHDGFYYARVRKLS